MSLFSTCMDTDWREADRQLVLVAVDNQEVEMGCHSFMITVEPLNSEVE